MSEKHCMADIILIAGGLQAPHSGDGDWYGMDDLPAKTVQETNSGTDVIVCPTSKGTNATVGTVPYESGYRFWWNLYRRQEAGESLTLSFYNPNNGDRHSAGLTILQTPGQSAAKTTGSVSWALRLSNVVGNIEYGTAL